MEFEYKIKTKLLPSEFFDELDMLYKKGELAEVEKEVLTENVVMLGIASHMRKNIKTIEQSLDSRISDKVTPETVKYKIEKLLDEVYELEDYGVSSDILDSLRFNLSCASDSLSPEQPDLT